MHGARFPVPSKEPEMSRTASRRNRGSALDMSSRDRRRNQCLSDCARHIQQIQTASCPTRERRRALHSFPADKRRGQRHPNKFVRLRLEYAIAHMRKSSECIDRRPLAEEMKGLRISNCGLRICLNDGTYFERTMKR